MLERVSKVTGVVPCGRACLRGVCDFQGKPITLGVCSDSQDQTCCGGWLRQPELEAPARSVAVVYTDRVLQ